MRVLVIGASGQIGGHLHAQLQAQGHTVAGTYASQPRPGLVKLDTSDATAVEAAIKDVNPPRGDPAGRLDVGRRLRG